MKLELKNIGMLKKANVNINGLTVIAGENDTGKSTVGKILFSIIKAMSRYEEDFQESREYKIEVLLDRLFFEVRRSVKDLDEHTHSYMRDVLSLDYLYDYYENNHGNEVHADYVESLRDTIYNLHLSEVKIVNINNLINELAYMLNTPEDKQKSIQNALNKVFRTEFNSNILMHNERSGFIKLFENELLLLDIEINRDNKVILKNEVEPIEIDEATFIETPLVLNNHDLLIQSKTGLDITKRSSSRLGVPYTTLHIKDLFEKLRDMNFLSLFSDSVNEKKIDEVRNSVSSVISGKIEYDFDEKDFVYLKEKQRIPIKNTATGIKAFGTIQLLIQNGFINNTSMLILDEPEIHLHPKWQLKYAQIISLLARNDVPILVTSHSPYMIEALKRFSDLDSIEEKTNFYLSENRIIENENKLEDIFRVLSEPFEIFRKMDEGILSDE